VAARSTQARRRDQVERDHRRGAHADRDPAPWEARRTHRRLAGGRRRGCPCLWRGKRLGAHRWRPGGRKVLEPGRPEPRGRTPDLQDSATRRKVDEALAPAGLVEDEEGRDAGAADRVGADAALEIAERRAGRPAARGAADGQSGQAALGGGEARNRRGCEDDGKQPPRHAFHMLRPQARKHEPGAQATARLAGRPTDGSC
jgi:hypothetical protein